jgi:hypothetical protein
MMSRRRVMTILAGACGLPLLRPARVEARVRGPRLRHPDPRPDIDASAVLPRERVAPHAADLYDHVREIPHIVDGIRCHCGCGDLPGMYSLLSCYGESGMAQYCEVCSGEGALAWELHGQGRTLDEIRAAIDRRFA